MASYAQVIVFSLIGGVLSLIGGILLLSRRSLADALAQYATPLAAGALIAAVFLDLLRDGLEESTPEVVLLGALIGIIVFFYAERFLHWFHHHKSADENHVDSDPVIKLIIAGDLAHNALDGVAIAAAFLVSVPTGIVTTIAVAAHEIPQEIADFGLMLARGLNRAKVLMINVLSALATTLFAVITFALGSEKRLPIGLLLGLSAGFLLYIAMSDIIPTIHQSARTRRLFDIQPLLLLVGVIIVGVTIQVVHGFVEL